MEVYTLFVGQGHLTVIAREDEAIIVDTHLPGPNDSGIYVKPALAKALRGRKLVGLILTSFDADHADPRGITMILGTYWPYWVMYPSYYKDTRVAGEVFGTIKSFEARWAGSRRELERIPIRLDRLEGRMFDDLADNLAIEVFSPHPQDMDCSNNSSLVARVTPKGRKRGFSYLITGDTENDRWVSINRIFGADLQSDVMEAPHHGSKNGINAETLALVQPSIALVSAGTERKYGHPHVEALRLFKQAGTQCFSTHEGCSLRTFAGPRGLQTEVWNG